MNLLVLLLVIPLAGGVLCWLAEKIDMRLPRWIALASLAAVTAISVQLLRDFHPITPGNSPWQLEYLAAWIPGFHIRFHLGIDGLSLLMVLLTAFLGTAAIVCSWREINHRNGFFYLNLLWNISGVLGVFLALDLMLFFFCWELMLVPMYFLIALWGHQSDGGKSRIYAANKFFIFTQGSGLLLLISILVLVFVHYAATQQLSFDYDTLVNAHLQLKQPWDMILMLGFFIAFAVKLPVVPLHSWLPDAHANAPTAGSVDLAGILLKTAAYGMLRFAIPLFPLASQQFAPVAMWLGVIGIFYGAILACAQTDAKRLIAYTSVSHMGFVLIGIYAGTLISLQGVVIQMLAHGISAGALFILCGEMYERIGTRDLRSMGGLWHRIAWLPAITLFFAVASLGMPGLGNFVGEFLILLGASNSHLLIVSLATIGLVLAAIYSLSMVQKAFYGKPHDGQETIYESLTPRELGLLLALMLALLVLGVQPQSILDISAPVMQHLFQLFSTVTG